VESRGFAEDERMLAPLIRGENMAQTFVADELIDAASKATGLQRFDSESFRDGLEVLLADANHVAYPDMGIERFRSALVGALSTRLKTTAYLEQRPELLKRPIERPVFVFGIPRTGTTLLSNLLAADPARRSPLSWEIDDPVPPPTQDLLYTDPRALARLDMERKMLAARPDAGKYYRGSAIYPNECMFFIAHDFKALMWEGRGKLPNYRDWLFAADLTSTYQYHKRFLQILQADAPGVWNLKQPSHGLWLETLLKLYPDARLIWTHRDPLTATGSFCSLMKMGSQSFGLTPDLEWIASNYPWQAVQHAERIMNSRQKMGHDRIIDVHYADLLRNPLPTMRKLYQSLGDEFTPQAEAGMNRWIADNPQDKFGRHEYKLAQFGLTPEKVRGMFERYLSQYEVEREG
jgi:Sulfotransferase family